MFPDDLNSLARDIMNRINGREQSPQRGKQAPGNSGGTAAGNGGGQTERKPALTPSSALVIGGLLTGVLEVDSVLVDKNQTVQIVLSGSLKQKTQLEKMLDQIGSMPFDDVVKAMLGRLE